MDLLFPRQFDKDDYLRRMIKKFQKQARQGKQTEQTILNSFNYYDLKSINQYRLVTCNLQIVCKYIRDMSFVSEEMQPFFNQDINKFKDTVNTFQKQMKEKLNYFHDLDLTIAKLNDQNISACLHQFQQYLNFILFTSTDIQAYKKQNKLFERLYNLRKTFGIDEIEHMITSSFISTLINQAKTLHQNKKVNKRYPAAQRSWKVGIKA